MSSMVKVLESGLLGAFFCFLFLTPNLAAEPSEKVKQVVDAARSQVGKTVGYDPSYVKLKYPGGDVPIETGVCTDVVIRSFRAIGIDLQKELHEDLSANFSLYPNKEVWGLTKADKNIDHRRVPNLRVFFSRKGQSLSIKNFRSSNAKPGDVLTWKLLPHGATHIGVVSDRKSRFLGKPLVIHNVGEGAREENIIGSFGYKLTGHYRYLPTK